MQQTSEGKGTVMRGITYSRCRVIPEFITLAILNTVLGSTETNLIKTLLIKGTR